MKRFILKKIKRNNSKRVVLNNNKEVVSFNNDNKTEKVMNTKEKVELASAILAQDMESTPKEFKKIKKEKGLIEKVESSKTILTEDGKELLKD